MSPDRKFNTQPKPVHPVVDTPALHVSKPIFITAPIDDTTTSTLDSGVDCLAHKTNTISTDLQFVPETKYASELPVDKKGKKNNSNNGKTSKPLKKTDIKHNNRRKMRRCPRSETAWLQQAIQDINSTPQQSPIAINDSPVSQPELARGKTNNKRPKSKDAIKERKRKSKENKNRSKLYTTNLNEKLRDGKLYRKNEHGYWILVH